MIFSTCRQLTRVAPDPSPLLILWKNTVGPAPTSHKPSGPGHEHIPEWMQVGTYLGLDALCSPGRAPAGTGPSPPAVPAAHHTVEGGYQPENPKPRAPVSTTKLILAHKASLWARLGPDSRDSRGGRQNSECNKKEADFYPFSRGTSIPSPGDLPDPGIEPWCLALQVGSLPTELSRKSHRYKNKLVVTSGKREWEKDKIGAEE